MDTEKQIERLADYIMDNFPDEIRDAGAVDVAIQIMEKYKERR